MNTLNNSDQFLDEIKNLREECREYNKKPTNSRNGRTYLNVDFGR